MEHMEYSHREWNQIKWQVYGQLAQWKEQILLLYRDIEEKGVPMGERSRAEIKTVAEEMCSCTVLFAMPAALQKQCVELQQEVEKNLPEEENYPRLLEALFETWERLAAYIEKKAKKCNACQSDVFFMPMLADYIRARKVYGFPYWNADFQLESRENFCCPVCGALDRDRLMIAFLEEVRAEGGGMLRMLQVAPSSAVERYALNREDIWYESTDLVREDVTFQADLQHMDMVADAAYDIIVCSHVLEHVKDDAKAMRELKRILKPDGVCVVLVPLVAGKPDTEEEWGCSKEENWRRFGQSDHSRLYGREDFIRRLQKAGFYVNELGKEWFGEEFYQAYGFDDLSILYVVTKEIRLVEQDL